MCLYGNGEFMTEATCLHRSISVIDRCQSAGRVLLARMVQRDVRVTRHRAPYTHLFCCRFLLLCTTNREEKIQNWQKPKQVTGRSRSKSSCYGLGKDPKIVVYFINFFFMSVWHKYYSIRWCGLITLRFWGKYFFVRCRYLPFRCVTFDAYSIPLLLSLFFCIFVVGYFFVFWWMTYWTSLAGS